MASEEGRWLTYAEVGAQLGISADAARQLAKRRGWQRRIPNEHNAPATVLLPSDAAVRSRRPVTPDAPGNVQATTPDRPGDGADNVRAIAVLVGQLAQERSLSIRAEQRATELQADLTEVKIALADARAAERIASAEAAALRTQIDQRRTWRFARRLLYAIRGS